MALNSQIYCVRHELYAVNVLSEIQHICLYLQNSGFCLTAFPGLSGGTIAAFNYKSDVHKIVNLHLPCIYFLLGIAFRRSRQGVETGDQDLGTCQTWSPQHTTEVKFWKPYRRQRLSMSKVSSLQPQLLRRRSALNSCYFLLAALPRVPP